MASLYTMVYTHFRAEKALAWVGSSLEDLRAFPAKARRLAGYQLRRVQSGLRPSDWRPVKAVGPAVIEIRIRTDAQYRILYVAHFGEAIYVLHVFEKREARTRKAELTLARRRLAELAWLRRKER